MADLLLTVLRVNLVLTAAVLLVLVLRKPVRRWFGAHLAYGLWWIAPVAALTAALPMAPVRGAHAAARPDQALWSALGHLLHRLEGWLPALWLAGALAVVVLMALSQRAFARREALGEAGPAVVGVINPRLVMPAWARQNFTDEERSLIRAHERAHMDRQDPRVNAALALVQAVLWFNPMIHLAARYLRRDQELACDATVMARLGATNPGARRRYAETLLKTQLTAQPLPLGCHWTPRGRHPLEERIGALAQAAPSANRRDIGIAIIAAVTLATCGAAWAAQPSRVEEEGSIRIVFVDLTPGSLTVVR